MSYSMDLSSMFLEDLELFPECVLPGAAEKNDQLQLREPGLDYISSLDDALYPDWLDLKMDLSFLEGLETPDKVLDDLLLDEANTGLSLDTLPTFQVEDRSPLPLDFEQPPPDESTLPSESAYTAPSPPSSPECCVPEMITPDTPVSMGSPVSRPGSPDCLSTTALYQLAPSPVETTFLTFVTPILHPVSVIASAVEVQSLPLDVSSLPFVPAGHDCSVEVQLQPDLGSCIPLSPLGDEASAKPRRERKRKAGPSGKKCSAKLRALTSELEGTETCVPPPASRKERKRQQNKDAAMRYRLKKRMESDTTSAEEGLLLEQNRELKEKAQQLATELGYLKNLMREMFKSKGLLK